MNLLTVTEVAKELRLTTEAVRRLLRAGKLSGYKMSSQRWLVDQDDLKRYIREHKQEQKDG